MFIFVLFKQQFNWKIVNFSRIRTRILGIEGEHADHLTIITTIIKMYAWSVSLLVAIFRFGWVRKFDFEWPHLSTLEWKILCRSEKNPTFYFYIAFWAKLKDWQAIPGLFWIYIRPFQHLYKLNINKCANKYYPSGSRCREMNFHPLDHFLVKALIP